MAGVVKVCGLTSLDDARAARDAGADWLGFVVKGESPRTIPAAHAAAIVAALPGAITVAVMVGPTPAEALEVVRATGVTRIQLHRVEASAWPVDYPVPAAFAVPMDAEGVLQAPLPAPGRLVLLDRAHPKLAGGTGDPVPWASAAALARERDVLLAGGLGPDNVARAIRAVRPWGVDASSRLESAPGIKDHDRVRRFVAAARRALEEGTHD